MVLYEFFSRILRCFYVFLVYVSFSFIYVLFMTGLAGDPNRTYFSV